MSNRISRMFVSPLMGTGALVLLVVGVVLSYAKHVREVWDAEDEYWDAEADKYARDEDVP